ncbi:MAG TPA: catalase family peroxidase, partial [Acidimicrobiales bacterium]|nr:catalase family peroxidase [Acidimicrobiales bacterium]
PRAGHPDRLHRHLSRPRGAVVSDPDLGEALVDAVQAVTGVHPGRRVLHAKGVGAEGRFRSSGAAAHLTTAPHLQPAAEVGVVVRFSNGSADADAHDGARDGRGMATKFRLDDGSSTDIVALSLPVFFVRTTDDFVEFVRARQPDPTTGEMDLDRVLGLLGAHPEAQLAAQLSVAAPAPASYSQVTYHGVHVFWMVGAAGERTPVRYRWEPATPGDGLPDDEAMARPRDYLADALAADLDAGPVRFDLHVVVGEPGDPVGDPTSPWPDDRASVVAGTLELTSRTDAEPLIFDPTNVVDGIECSDDPILAARAAAYSVSYARRTS